MARSSVSWFSQVCLSVDTRAYSATRLFTLNNLSEMVVRYLEGKGRHGNGKHVPTVNRQQKTRNSNEYAGLRFLLQKYNNSH